jgi:hypothetical protein
VLIKINEDCYIVVIQQGKQDSIDPVLRDWDCTPYTVDGTYFGSPFKLKKEVVFYTREPITQKLQLFFNEQRSKTYWDTSLVLTPSVFGLTDNQTRAYRNFLFENKNLVDESVLIVRQKRPQDRFCKVVKIRQTLPSIRMQGKSNVAWNVYDPSIQKTYDIRFDKQISLVLDGYSGFISGPSKRVLSQEIPDKFYRDLSIYLDS